MPFSNQTRIAFLCLCCVAIFTTPGAPAQESPVPIKIPLRVVIFTEDDGSNPATSLKLIDHQVAQLRADGARHGLEFAFQATTFVADSQRRRADADELGRRDGKGNSAFPCSKDSIVLYVTRLTGRDSVVVPYVLQPPADSSSQPAIVIDAHHFGGQGCGPAKDQPCRALTEALADALAKHAADSVLRDAAENMKKEALRAQQE